MNTSESTATSFRQPLLAFLSSVFVLGLGLVYVGRVRLAMATIAAVYGVVAFFSWTRLIVSTPYGCWVVAGFILLIVIGTAICGAVLAARSRAAVANWYNRWWFYVFWTLSVFGLSLTAYRTREHVFGYGTYVVPSVSMIPTIDKGEYFIADTWRYPAHQPAVGDIVVLELADGTGIRYLKRIVGLPRDRIEIRDRVVYRNGQALLEPYVRAVDDMHSFGRSFEPIEVEDGKVFVLGDNRDNSKDSRHWGTIPINQLRGRAQFLWLSKTANGVSFSRIGTRLIP